MNGPPLAIYGSMRRWSAPQFRATMQAYFLRGDAFLKYVYFGLEGIGALLLIQAITGRL